MTRPKSTTPPPSQPAPDEVPALRVYQRQVGKQSFPVRELVSLQSEGNYTWLSWADGKRMLMPRTLKFYTPMLPDDLFVRLHRNSIVNMECITKLERNNADGGIITLCTNERLVVSRRRWASVRAAINAYRQARNTDAN